MKKKKEHQKIFKKIDKKQHKTKIPRLNKMTKCKIG